MFKALLKKRNGNKGFTLIELIVVIAILAILALLLVPRFAGFTDSAREQADEAAMKTIETAITTMLATGKMEVGASAGTVTYVDSTNLWSVSVVSASAIQTEMDKLLGTDIDAQTGTGFQATVSTAGAITSIVVTH